MIAGPCTVVFFVNALIATLLSHSDAVSVQDEEEVAMPGARKESPVDFAFISIQNGVDALLSATHTDNLVPEGMLTSLLSFTVW